MHDKPADIYRLLYQALASEIELGREDMILRPSRMTPVAPAPTVGAQTTERVISAAGAISGGVASTGSELSLQTGLTMTPEYASLENHRSAICDCQKCPLGQTRNKFVYGTGNANADIMFVGEAPGADEDRQGEPFVGRAGQLLDKILAAMQLDRTQIYIANILKCRPPGNRDPQPEEMAQCTPYLQEQVRLIRPKIMCALGRIAAQSLLRTTTPLGKLRGRFHSFEGIDLIVTYHPAALLRFAQYKKDCWADMQMLMAHYQDMK